MRSHMLSSGALVLSLLCFSQAQLFTVPEKAATQFKVNDISSLVSNGQQQPIIRVLDSQSSPESMENSENTAGQTTALAGRILIADLIGSQQNIKIFAGLTRDIDSIAERLDSANEKTTLLAPLNSVMSDLPRKPWEDPREYSAFGAAAYEGADGESRAHANLRRFTEAHVVPTSPWKEGEKVASLGGGTLWWEIKDGKTILHPGSVEVDRVISRAANGEVWVIKGVINYAS